MMTLYNRPSGASIAISIISAAFLWVSGQPASHVSIHTDVRQEVNFGDVRFIPSSNFITNLGDILTRGEENVSFKCNLVGDGVYSPMRFLVYNAEKSYSCVRSGTVLVKPGKYDVCAEFVCGDYSRPYFARVIKEDIEITEEKEMNLDVSEAVNVIRMGSMLPDGRRVTLPAGNGVEVESNAERIVIYTMASHDDYKFFSYGVGEATFTGKDGSSEQAFDFLVNNVNSKYHFMQARLVRINSNEVMYHCPATSGVKDAGKILVNEASKVAVLSEKFQLTPISRNFNRMQDRFMCQGFGLFHGKDLGGFSASFGGDECRILVVDNSDGENEIDFQPLVYSGALDIQDVVLTFDNKGNITGQESVQSGVYGCPVILKNGEFIHVNPNNLSLDNVSCLYPEKNLLHGHDSFSYRHDEANIYSATTPFISLFPAANGIDISNPRLLFQIGSIGRHGEIRKSDLYQMGAELRNEKGEILFTGTQHGINDAIARAVEAGNKGLVLKASNRNIETGGEMCLSEVEVGWDVSNEDFIPPVMTMMRTVDKEGRISDMINTAEDCFIEFTGGKFRWNNANQSFTEGGNIEVLVEIGDDANGYESLEVTEVVELYHLPAFGHFYRAKIKGGFSDGYKNLKITFKDESGNYQRQLLERGLCFINQSGIDDMLMDDGILLSGPAISGIPSGSTVRIFDISGVPVIDNVTESCIDLRELLSSGMYLVKVEGKSFAKTFKIIIQ